jgi:Zn-dependent protease
MIFSFNEILDLGIMTLFLGIIFWNSFRLPTRQVQDYEPLKDYSFGKKEKKKIFRIPLHDFWNAVMIVAPAVALHEMGHKFAALSFGMQAVFHADYLWLAIGLVLKLAHFPFIIFVPGYVEITGAGTPLTGALIAFAGPAVNLALWLGSILILKKKKNLSEKQRIILAISSKVNMFLFIFNMLPLWNFDGAKVFSGLIQTLF